MKLSLPDIVYIKITNKSYSILCNTLIVQGEIPSSPKSIPKILTQINMDHAYALKFRKEKVMKDTESHFWVVLFGIVLGRVTQFFLLYHDSKALPKFPN